MFLDKSQQKRAYLKDKTLYKFFTATIAWDAHSVLRTIEKLNFFSFLYCI